MMRTLAALLLLVSGLSWGHTYHAVRTQIQFNEHTRTVEIVHRAFVNDLSSLMEQELGEHHEISQTEQDNQWLKAYWQRYFAFVGDDRQRLPVNWVGFEVNDYDLWIYQEYTGDLQTLMDSTIHNGLLFGYYEHQVNTVDINLGGLQNALVFTLQNLRQPMMERVE